MSMTFLDNGPLLRPDRTPIVDHMLDPSWPVGIFCRGFVRRLTFKYDYMLMVTRSTTKILCGCYRECGPFRDLP